MFVLVFFCTARASQVLGALVTAGVYQEPFYGKNLDNINASAFDVSWWYRCEFKIGAKGTYV